MEIQATQTAACGACRYWEQKSGAEGECRRHAPQTIVFNVDAQTRFESRFPITAAEDWCGDFHPRGELGRRQ